LIIYSHSTSPFSLHWFFSFSLSPETGGTIAQAIAAHEPPRTTKLYDRTSDEISLDEVERIAI